MLRGKLNYIKMSVLITLYILMILTPILGEAQNQESNRKDVSLLSVYKDLKQAKGQIWYVDGINGDDKNGNGASLESAWKTIGAAFDYYANRPGSGDTIVIAAGTYNESIDVRNKGTADKPILIGPLGNGEVIIDVSQKIKEWTIYKGNIYKASCPFKPIAVVADEKPLFSEFSLDKVDNGKWYYDNKAKILYLYISGDGNPSLHDIGVISDDEYSNGIFLNHAEYVTLYGLTVKYAGGYGISVLGNNNRIEKCNIKFNGKGGISIWPYEDTISTDNVIIKNYIYHNMLRNWPRGRYKWGSWAAGAGDRAKNTKYIGNVVHNNGGEGLLSFGGLGGTLFSNNIVYDNWSVNIYVDGQPDCVVEKNFIFCNEPNPADLYNNGDENPKDGKNFRRLRAEGIMTADEGKSAKFQNAKIVNNIIIGCRRGITHYGQAKDSGLKNVLIANNTIIVLNTKGVGEDFIGISVPYNNGQNINAVYRNNIVYASHPDTYLVSVGTDPNGLRDGFDGLTFDHNLWYHSSNLKPFQFGSFGGNTSKMDFKNWVKKGERSGQCVGSKFADPKFVGTPQYSANAAKLMPNSPAIDAGVSIEGVSDDYEGNKRAGKPNIGALEFISQKEQ